MDKYKNAKNDNQAEAFERKRASIQEDIDEQKALLEMEDNKKVRSKDFSVKYGLIE